MNTKIKTIQVPSGIKYLADIAEIKENPNLLKNIILDKSRTGCGATTYFMSRTDEKYIITVPFINIINSKVNSNYGDYVFPISSSHNKAKSLFLKDINKNIICTYDQLEKIVPFIDVKEWNLVIDECQVLQSQYDFRTPVMNYILQHYKDFKSFCFVSAYPERIDTLEDDNVNTLKINWDTNKPDKDFKGSDTTSIRNFVLMFAKKNENDSYHNFHFYCNNVGLIKSIVDNKYNFFNDNNCRVVYSKSNKKEIKNVTNSDITSEVKHFNFYTSTCFEGCDIYDEKGVNIILMDDRKQYKTTILDINLIKQAANRIRNSKFSTTYIFYNIGNEDADSPERMLEYKTNKELASKNKIKTLNNIIDNGDIESAIEFYQRLDVNKYWILFNKKEQRFCFNVEGENYELNKWNLSRMYRTGNIRNIIGGDVEFENISKTNLTNMDIEYYFNKDQYKEQYKEYYQNNKGQYKEQYKEKQENGTGYIKKENSLKDIIFRILNHQSTESDIKKLKTVKVGDNEFSVYKCIKGILDSNTRNEFISYCNKINWYGPNIKQWIVTRLKRQLNRQVVKEKELVETGVIYNSYQIEQIVKENNLTVKDLLEQYEYSRTVKTGGIVVYRFESKIVN